MLLKIGYLGAVLLLAPCACSTGPQLRPNTSLPAYSLNPAVYHPTDKLCVARGFDSWRLTGRLSLFKPCEGRISRGVTLRS